MILTVTLNAAVARTLVVPSLTLGHRHRAPATASVAGGRATTGARPRGPPARPRAREGAGVGGGRGRSVARALRTRGVPVLAAGFAGGRNGDAIRDGLSEGARPFDLVEIEGAAPDTAAPRAH